MTCRTCGLVKTSETRKYFIPNRSGHCRGCTMAIYHHRGRIGDRVESRPKAVPKPPKMYAHTSDYLSSGRDRTRELVRIRDKHTCQMCRSVWETGRRRLDVHHLNGLCGKLSKSYDKVSTIHTMITLCHRCHFNHPQHTLKTR